MTTYKIDCSEVACAYSFVGPTAFSLLVQLLTHIGQVHTDEARDRSRTMLAAVDVDIEEDEA